MRGCMVKSSENNYSVMNRIMLRFRPIAPKPVGGEAVPDASDEKRNGGVRNGIRRTKRKYVRVRTRTTKRKTESSPPEKSAIDDGSLPGKGVVTLQLLPERSESFNNNITAQKNWSDIDHFTVDNNLTAVIGGGAVALSGFRSAIETWIMVESVTDAYMDTEVGLGFSDREKMNNLEVDNCPAFVSDYKNNVVWVNDAYKSMVAEGEAAEEGVTVRLVVNEKLPHFYPSFACRVRLIQHTKHGQKWNRIVPCDVWRMEFGGFAWKLDVNTALGLGI
ncbi:hypothetical protein ACJIZ3_015140 [Penstemon smallii]|uniref:DUF7950 domain-containing protein n=1 Tax=Penstemon smallii TaxID=265156 RepID=A0ABD3RLM7_9LAMI